MSHPHSRRIPNGQSFLLLSPSSWSSRRKFSFYMQSKGRLPPPASSMLPQFSKQNPLYLSNCSSVPARQASPDSPSCIHRKMRQCSPIIYITLFCRRNTIEFSLRFRYKILRLRRPKKPSTSPRGIQYPLEEPRFGADLPQAAVFRRGMNPR